MAEAGIERKRGLGIFTALWAVVLIAAFFADRSDVGKLPSLFSNLGGGPLIGGSAFDSLVGLIVSVLIIQAWVGLGRAFYGFLPLSQENRPRSMFLMFALSAGLGSAVWSLIWFVLGLAGGYSKVAAIICIVAGNLLLAIPLRFKPKGDVRAELDWRRVSPSEWALILFIAIPVVMALIASLAPPVAKDTLLYHFALPKAYIAQHSNSIVDGNIASFLPLGAEMHYVWAMLLGGWFSQRAAEASAGGTSFWFLAFLLYAVYGWARELNVERAWALVAVLIIATIPTAYHVAASSYVDVSLALFVTLSVYALSRWWKAQERSWLVLIAIFLGGALSIKLTSLFVFAAFALVVLLRSRKAKESSGAGKVLLAGIGALLLAGVFASPWYLRTWKATGSPVFPFYMSMWKGEAPGWDVERSNLFQAMNSQYGGEKKSPEDYILSPWNISVKAQPEEPAYFDGVIGVSFLLGLPLLIFVLWKFDVPIDVKIAAGITVIMFLFWLFSSQQLRYLLPVLPLCAIGIVVSAARALNTEVERSIAKWSFVAAAIVGLLTAAAWFSQIAPVRVVLGGEPRDQYLARNLDYYPYYQWLNTQTPPEAKVWLINMRRDTYNLDRPVVSDYLFEDWTLRKMIWESRNASELRAKASELGIQYVLTRHDFLFDYDKSTIVDDRKPRAENEAKLRMAKEFILDPARTVKADDRFSLIKVF
jgi:hypothetical protein